MPNPNVSLRQEKRKLLNEKEKEKKLRKSAGSFRQSRIRESERGKRK
jgi:hypothetical protein